MKLKEIILKPQNPYVEEFFASVATEPEGKFFRYEKPATANFLRGAAYKAEKTLGKKFSIHEVKDGDQKAFAVGWTTKTRAKRGPKPAASAQVTTTSAETGRDPLLIGSFRVQQSESTPADFNYELGGSGSEIS